MYTSQVFFYHSWGFTKKSVTYSKASSICLVTNAAEGIKLGDGAPASATDCAVANGIEAVIKLNCVIAATQLFTPITNGG